MAPSRPHAVREPEDATKLLARYSELTAMSARLIDECRRLQAENDALRQTCRRLDEDLRAATSAGNGVRQRSWPGQAVGDRIVLRPKPDRRQQPRTAVGPELNVPLGSRSRDCS